MDNDPCSYKWITTPYSIKINTDKFSIQVHNISEAHDVPILQLKVRHRCTRYIWYVGHFGVCKYANCWLHRVSDIGLGNISLKLPTKLKSVLCVLGWRFQSILPVMGDTQCPHWPSVTSHWQTASFTHARWREQSTTHLCNSQSVLQVCKDHGTTHRYAKTMVQHTGTQRPWYNTQVCKDHGTTHRYAKTMVQHTGM